MDITFVYPSGGDINLSKFGYNLGSAYIIAYLRKYGFETEQFVSNDSFNVRECVKKITIDSPKVVGFTVLESNFMQCVLISNGLKKYNSDIIVIFGGPTPTTNSKDTLEVANSVDLCVRGEGEEVLLKLMSVLSNNDFKLNKVDLSAIKGITFKKGDEIIINPNSNVLLSNRSIKNYLDTYPSPFLTQVIPTSEVFAIGIITARGCNQNCTYCNCAVVNNRNIFFHSIGRVIEELRYINENKEMISGGTVPINDDTFTIIPSRTKTICEEIIKNDIKLPLNCITRCDKINEELLDLMKQAGFVSIGFSLESAVPKVLRSIGKVNSPESMILKDFNKEIEYIQKLKRMVDYAKKIGINLVSVSIMIGLPGETIQDARKTITLVKQLNIDFYAHNHFHIYKGTPIYNNYKNYGYHVEPMGQNNKILLTNDFPFDVYKISLAPNSIIEQNKKVIDYANLKTFSLSTSRMSQKPFFENLIINRDTINQSLVEWIQENLSINGKIIHIYSNKRKYKTLYQENERTLYNEFSPTKDYNNYFWEKGTKPRILKSGIMSLWGNSVGIPVKIKNTNSALKDYKNESTDIEFLICREDSKIDTQAMRDLLVSLSNNNDSIDNLLKYKPLPFFQNLCRWTIDNANCTKLETAIIGSNNEIRVCWHSAPIGSVFSSFSKILRNLQLLRQKEEEKRNCKNCLIKDTCIKCIFPFPLSSYEYCQYKKSFDTTKPSKLINLLEIFKDLLIKPISTSDY